MKESIGGTILLNLMLFFMIIYILFMSGIMKYASALKSKNAIVNIIENAKTEVTCQDYKDKLSEDGYDGNFVIEQHTNDTIAKSYYTVKLTSDIPLIPGILIFKIPVVGETKLIDSRIQIAHTGGNEISVINGACS